MLPSWDEPFGLSAAESLAMRTPILVGSVGGVGEYVEDGVSGRVLPPHEPDAWAAAAIELLEDPARRAAMGRAGSERVLRFNDRAYGHEMTAAYDRAIGRWRRRRARRRGDHHG